MPRFNKKILIIDDDPQVRKLFKKKLSAQGYDIDEATDGIEGVRVYCQRRYDLVITDLIMPDKEGLQAIRELKKEFPDIKIIAISGGGQKIPDDYLPVAEIVGARRTFSKPIEWPEMLLAVKALLE